MTVSKRIAGPWLAALSLLVVLLAGSALHAQYIAVTGFNIVDLGNNTYRFVPVCSNNTCLPQEMKAHLYMWEFGDGDYSFDSIPTKTYYNAGDYAVVLRVTNIYEDTQRKRESPANKLVTKAMPTQRVSVARPLSYGGKTVVPSVIPNAIVKAGYPVKYEYQMVNTTGGTMSVSGKLSRDPRQYWKPASATVPFTADYNPNLVSMLTFVPNDSTLKFTATIPANTTASIVLTFNAATDLDGSTPLSATLDMLACNASVGSCDSTQTTTTNKVGKSWDPNSIQAIPERFAIAGEELAYIIHFENYGTAAAQRIVIVDTLPSILDIATFTKVNSSHPEYLDSVIVKGRVVTWYFNEIYLPGRNPRDVVPRNQGYVTYKVRVNQNAYPRTLVENWAWIQFDQNPPIRTNYETNRVLKEECEPSISMRSLIFLILLLIVLALALIYVIARYRLRNPVTLQQIAQFQQAPMEQTQQQSQQDMEQHS
jgi:uncharacterized repeat protein (TIGR01451 family)